MKPITYEPCDTIADALDEYMTTEIDRLFVIPERIDIDNGVMHYNAWVATPEGRLHMQLMTRYVISSDTVNARQANLIQTRLQGQGKEPKGRPRRYDPKKHNITFQRKVRLYLLDCLIAKGLGLNPAALNPPVVPRDPTLNTPYGWTAPTSVFDSLRRFEAWSKLTLPHSAWVAYTKEERTKLAEARPELQTDEDGAVKLGVFINLHSTEDSEPSTMQMPAIAA